MGGVRTVLAALGCLAVLSGCGPWGPKGIVPGGRLAGEAATASDWSFSDAHPLVAVETRGRLFRHSVTVLCMAVDGRLYIPSRHAPSKRWVQNVLRDPRVRIGIAGRIYEGRAVRIQDPSEADAVARAMLRKYVGVEAQQVHALAGPPPPGDERAEVWIFRIDPPDGA
jgi:hypothetical protein